ncbi:Cdc50p like membrane protein [Cryptosporidium ryanae]|uniref:Cdc50p like membrane protein n=1 Tax=Cryptosporidium ryanae TaxID=515981 RepID=UPI00351AAE83|nr:Cdc50p like membrane protein [Cryptosporidium ryanae]
MGSNCCRNELHILCWIQKLKEGEQKVDDVIDSFVQQDMNIWNPGKKLFHPNVAVLLFFIGSVIHAIFAAFFYINYISKGYVEYSTEPITKGKDNLTINVTSDVNGPAYLNVYIDNFYQNFRSFVQSRPPEIFPGFSCGTANTLGYLQRIRGDTLNNFIVNIKNESSSPSEDTPLIPCGLSSLTFFNDEFDLLKLNDDGSKEKIEISFENSFLRNDFSMFAIPFNDKMWIKTTDIHYRTWMHGAWLPNFKMVWGKIEQNLSKGLYEIKMRRNLWPAEEFNSRKRIGIEKVSFVGSKNFIAGCFFFVWCIWLLFMTIILIIMIHYPNKIKNYFIKKKHKLSDHI